MRSGGSGGASPGFRFRRRTSSGTAEAPAPDGTPTVALNLRCLPDVDLDALTITHWDGASH